MDRRDMLTACGACAYHLIKKPPGLAVPVHHYCTQVSDEVYRCVVFDRVGRGARLLGVEDIVSDRLYRGLPEAERRYYHPHSYEVTGGLLTAPGLEPDNELKLISGLVTTWGKTWHTWPDPRAPLPLGEP